MTPAQWERVGELFDAALGMSGDRRAWLETTCPEDPAVRAEVLSLLENHQKAGEGFVEKQFEPAAASLLQFKGEDGPPSRVGPYRLVRELGQGGMGAVYLAERDDDEYKTQVAIKLVRRGFDTDIILNRFYRERQTLARLQHPHIARLLDGGTTPEGLPFIVMEYVEGSRITEFCRERNLSIPQRLTLFLNVCKAVEYAHRQFVVHRDLKPGNILVDKAGEVKLVDFGICKLLHSPSLEPEETFDAGPRPLTPDYASPEQIRGDPITVASDIYSLAAVLYELLTGAKPHRIENYTIQGIERGICAHEIIRPSLAAGDKQPARQLEGDLDNILLFALQKDPQRRYASIEQFADDIRRHLAHQPVMARPDTFSYRARKFMRRRRGSVAAAAAVVLALSAGLITSLRSARIANENLGMVRRLSNTFVFDVYDSVRDLPGSTKARQLIVKTGLQYLDNLARDTRGDADIQLELAAAYRRIGDVQGDVMAANLGDTTGALASYGKALTLLESALREDPSSRPAAIERITLHQRVGSLHAYTKNPAQAAASYQTAESLALPLLASFPDDEQIARRLAEIYNGWADAVRRSGDYTRAHHQFDQARELLERFEKAHPEDRELIRALAVAYAGLGQCEARLGRMQAGLEAGRKAAAQLETLVKLDGANVSYQRELMFAYSHIGDLLGNPNLRNLGDTAGAAEAYRRMVDVARHVHQSDPADQRARSDFGIALARVASVMPAGQPAERIKVLLQSIDLLKEVARVTPDNRVSRADMGFTYNFLGDAYQSAKDEKEAMDAYRDGLAALDPLLTMNSGTVITASLLIRRKLGELTAKRGDRETSLALAHSALELAAPNHPAAKGRPENIQRLLMPRAQAIMGFVYAALAGSSHRRPTDRDEARMWLDKGLRGFRALENLPTFNDLHRQEMRTIEKSLEAVR